MELRHIRCFVAVAEESHFGRAARRLHLSTPTVSQQVKALERETGVQLFGRHSRGATLTAAGEAFLPEARATLEAADIALRTVRRAGGIADAPLRLGLLTGVPDWLPGRLERALGAAAPGQASVHVAGSTVEQLGLLERGELELAVLRVPVDAAGDIEILPVLEEELGVLMSGSHPLCDRPVVRSVELAGQELIWFPRERAPRFFDETLGALRRAGGEVVVSQSTMSMGQPRSTLPLRTDAISLSTVRAARPPAVVWRPIEAAPLAATVAVAWRSGTRSPALRALVSELRAELEQGLWSN